ncbi:MAG: tyrosine-type recombinase/integrase [Patescibacteria group bacterium]|nr:tyrosine-type recombinase/integrase [Patescibacteria group bacterium]
MGRKTTDAEAKHPRGTVQKFKDARGRIYWRVRITLPDGERVWLKPRFDRKDRAQDYATDKSVEAEKRGVTVAKAAPATKGAGETCDPWHERYVKFCIEQGQTSVRNKSERWGKWISPKIGTKTMRQVTRDDVEDIRDALDDAIRAYQKTGPGDGRLAPKTAQNVWSELTVSFGEACSSKRRDLRVIESDPTNGVQPPERGSDKTKVYPYPSEFIAVVQCEAIPMEWRELHAVSVCTYARPGELRVLTWGDVDLGDQKIRITKAWDYDAACVKSTKTHESREIPIEPSVLPLLERMRARAFEAAKGDAAAFRAALVVPVLATANANKLAIIMRQHFELAGCVRERLNARSNAELRLRFRSWRDAGITWSIVRGDDVVKVQRRAGHKLIATTMRYIVEAENRGATFGTPFPPLPVSLLGATASKQSSKLDAVVAQAAGTAQDSGCRRRESKTPESTVDPGYSAAISEVNGDEGPQQVADKSLMPGPLDAGLDALDVVEAALAKALGEAAAAGRFDVVAQLARELEARRLVRAGVHHIGNRRALRSQPR